MAYAEKEARAVSVVAGAVEVDRGNVHGVDCCGALDGGGDDGTDDVDGGCAAADDTGSVAGH